MNLIHGSDNAPPECLIEFLCRMRTRRYRSGAKCETLEDAVYYGNKNTLKIPRNVFQLRGGWESGFVILSGVMIKLSREKYLRKKGGFGPSTSILTFRPYQSI